MYEEERVYSRIAYYLAKSTTCYLDAVVAIESGKGPEQRRELSDSEIYAANIMLIIAVNRVSMNFQQNPSVVHLLALEEFWKGIYSAEQIKSLQNEMNDKFNCLLVYDKTILETIGNLFCGLGQNDDAKIVEKLVEIYRLMG
ncbi:MAG: hypothetical protein WBM52_09090 [Thiogranum sp.]